MCMRRKFKTFQSYCVFVNAKKFAAEERKIKIWAKPLLLESDAYNTIINKLPLQDAEDYRRNIRRNTESFQVSRKQ